MKTAALLAKVAAVPGWLSLAQFSSRTSERLGFAVAALLTVAGMALSWHLPRQRMSVEEGIKDGKCPVLDSKAFPCLAYVSKDFPFLGARFRSRILDRHLASYQGERHRSPPKRRRHMSHLHFSLTLLQAKEIRSPNRRQDS